MEFGTVYVSLQKNFSSVKDTLINETEKVGIITKSTEMDLAPYNNNIQNNNHCKVIIGLYQGAMPGDFNNIPVESTKSLEYSRKYDGVCHVEILPKL